MVLALQKLLWALVFLYRTLCYTFYYGTWTVCSVQHQDHSAGAQTTCTDSGLAESSFTLILVGLPSGQWTRYSDELAIDSALKGRKSLRKKTRGRQVTRVRQKF